MRPESQGTQAEAMDSPTKTARGQDLEIIPPVAGNCPP
jgi:hypothetical protein